MTKITNLNLLLKDLIITNGIAPENLSNIQWRVENADENSILFYWINDEQKAEDLFIERILQKKIGAIIVNRGVKTKDIPALFVVTDFLAAQKIACDILLPYTQKIKLIGVTGTNGKTTTVHLCCQIGTLLGHKCISVGTLGVCDENGQLKENYTLTSPPYIEIRKILHKYQNKVEAIFFEVSSHALIQKRFYDIKFDSVAWISFGQDHLDFHQTMEEYKKAKIKLLTHHRIEHAPFYIPNSQHELVKTLVEFNPIIPEKLSEKWSKTLPLFFRCQFNQDNLEVSFAINKFLWGDFDEENFNFDKIALPDGRFSIYDFKNKICIIDSAHTPDALSNICSSIKKTFPHKKLWVLFGCGGDRDPHKRPLMAEVVSKYADFIVLTSDNSRNEDPQKIINETKVGLKSKNVIIEIDREKAVRIVFEKMLEKEILLLAGKGHEQYQLINGVKHPYSDFQALQNAAGIKI